MTTLADRTRRWARRIGLGMALLAVLALAVALALRLVPLPPGLFEPPPPSIELTDRHGRPLREVSTTDLVTRAVTLTEIPQSLIEATLAAEDRRFWQHSGVDWRATARAAWQLVRRRRVVSGGSTLTQQLIKLAQPRPRTPRTKVIEALQAWRLEHVWTKPQILLAYLNRLDYGNLRRGCRSAAAFYFGRAPADLSVAEAAFLAGLPQAPSRLNPLLHFERAKRRQEWILDRMTAAGWLDPAEARRARAAPVRLRASRRDFAAPHFVDLLLQRIGPRVATPAGGPLTTSLDLNLQRQVEQTLREHLDRLRAQAVRQGAVVVLRVPTGEVLALVGSGDYFAADAGQVNGTWAPRSAGSTFKPFTYLLALESGASPATLIADVPVEFPTPTGLYAPRNFDGQCHGPVRLREALANSFNIPAVRVLHDLGGAALLHERLRACGLTTLRHPTDHYGLGLTVGNAEARLLELANAYACLARLGEFRPFRLLPLSSCSCASSSSSSSSNRSRQRRAPDLDHEDAEDADEIGDHPGRGTRQLFNPEAAWLIADILSDDTARALSFGWHSPLRFEFPVACKTGTSTAFRDNWAFGYTPEFVVGVWMGNFDGAPMREVAGITGAAPVMHAIMECLHTRFGTTWYAPPVSRVETTIHRVTGRLVPPGRPDSVREKFLPGTLPAREQPGDYDDAGRIRLPAEYAAWLADAAGIQETRFVVAAASPGTASTTASATPPAPAIRLQQPLPASVYVLDPDLPDAGGWLPLVVEPSAGVTWSSPTLAIELRGGRPGARLREGRHDLVARDRVTGAEVRTWVQVRRL